MTFDTWYARNPLRKWREGQAQEHPYMIKKPLPRSAVFRAIGGSVQTIYAWETGEHRPNDESIVALARMMGIEPEVLAEDWEEWLRERPTMGEKQKVTA